MIDRSDVLDEVDNHRKPHYGTIIQTILAQRTLSYSIKDAQLANFGRNAVLHLFGVHYPGLCPVRMINIIKPSTVFDAQSIVNNPVVLYLFFVPRN